EAAEYFFHRCMHVYRGFSEAPGYRSLRSIEAGLRTAIGSTSLTTSLSGAQRTWKDYVADGTIIAGSPEQVTEQLRDLADELHVGHLMLLMQFGNMPRDKVMKNTRLFAEQVMPNLRNIWSDWEDKWWVKPLAQRQSPREVRAG